MEQLHMQDPKQEALEVVAAEALVEALVEALAEAEVEAEAAA